MRKMIHAVLIGVLLLPATGSRAADEDETRFRKDLARCRVSVKTKKWAAARKRFDQLLIDHEGRAYARREAASIEDDLKVCIFKLADRPPKASELLGEGVTKFRKSSRKIELAYDAFGPPYWKPLAKGYRVLDFIFAGDFVIHVESKGREFRLIIGLDTEKGTGYELTLDDGGGVIAPLGNFIQRPVWIVHFDDSRGHRLRLERKGSRILLSKNKKAAQMVRMRDGHVDSRGSKADPFLMGRIAVDPGTLHCLEIRGTLDKGWFLQTEREHESRRFEAWIAKSYDRTKALPVWLLSGPVAPIGTTAAILPSDAPAHLADRLGKAVRAYLAGDLTAFSDDLALLRPDLKSAPVTTAWMNALAAGGKGELPVLFDLMAAVLEKEPEFGPAHALLGLAHLRLRNDEAVVADLALAEKFSPDFPLTVLLATRAALVARDIAAADRILSSAVARGIRLPHIEAWARQIHRSHRGPNWTRRSRHVSSHFVVESDHSALICREVALRLEGAVTSYGRSFPRRKNRLRKARVRVFSNRGDYESYGSEVGVTLPGSRGAYMPAVRELVLFYVPGAGAIDPVVRHEGFHWYVHEIFDDLPIWFNEGNATCFETSTRKDGNPTPDAVNPVRRRELGMIKTLPDPAALMLMDGPTFMKDASTNYAATWWLVFLLRTTSDPALKGCFRDYARALQKGLSQQHAFEEVFQPVLGRLRKVYEARRFEVR